VQYDLSINCHLFYSILIYLHANSIAQRPTAVSRSKKQHNKNWRVHIAITIIIIPVVKVLLRAKKSKAGPYGLQWLLHYAAKEIYIFIYILFYIYIHVRGGGGGGPGGA
jgi:hypothetical protein